MCYSLWVHYTTSCNTQSSAPEDGQNNCPKHVELTGIINKPLLLNLVGCLYYLYQWRTVKQISVNEIYLLIKYIKSVLWRVAKRLSYTEDTRCLKVKQVNEQVKWDRKLTLQEWSECLNVSLSRIQHNVTAKLSISQVCVESGFNMISAITTNKNMEVCHSNTTHLKQHLNFLQLIITYNESQLRYYKSESKRQSSAWKHKD